MKPRITIAPTPDTVVAQISNLPKLGMAEIKSLWRRLFGGDTPTHNRQFLERRIAYKLQIIECRKTDRNLLERNQRRIDNLLEIGKQKSQTRSADYALTPGTVLCRHYQGVDHEVVVQADGTFLHGGQPTPTRCDPEPAQRCSSALPSRSRQFVCRSENRRYGGCGRESGLRLS